MKKCEKCGKSHDGSYGSGRFCSRFCANSRKMNSEKKEKISNGVKNSDYFKNKEYNDLDWDKINNDPSRLEKFNESILNRLLDSNWEDLGICQKRSRVKIEQNGKCDICGIDKWMGKHITLEYDHIDGNNTNESRDNVRYICPNCHSQTPTWRKNKKAP